MFKKISSRCFSLSILVLIAASVLFPAVAAAHVGHSTAAGGLVDGLLHPLTGLDHLLALVGAGLWARFQSGQTRWAMPAFFVGALILGAGAAELGLAMPALELGIGASVLVLGLLVATATMLPLRWAAPVAALFAFFHGYAHLAEIAATASVGVYVTGFVATSAAGLAAGFVLGALIEGQGSQRWNRAAGAGIATVGALFMTASLLVLVG